MMFKIILQLRKKCQPTRRDLSDISEADILRRTLLRMTVLNFEHIHKMRFRALELINIFGKRNTQKILNVHPNLLYRLPSVTIQTLKYLSDAHPNIDHKYIFVCAPRLLGCKPETISKRLTFLSEVFPDWNIEKLVKYCPHILLNKPDSIKQSISVLNKFILSEYKVSRILHSQPRILVQRFDPWRISEIEGLKQFFGDSFVTVTESAPNILLFSYSKNIKPKIDYLVHLRGLEVARASLINYPRQLIFSFAK